MSLYNKTTVKLKEGDRAWNFTTNIYNTSQNVTIQLGAFGLMFTNTGDTIVSINGKILYPGTVGTVLGDAFSIAAHKNDVLQGILKVAFAIPLGAVPALEIVQLYYMDYQ